MACEICKDKIILELKKKIGKHAPKLNAQFTRHKVIDKSGFFGIEKQLDICSVCSHGIKDFGGPRLPGNYEDSLILGMFTNKMLKFLKSKKRLVGEEKTLDSGSSKLFLDNPKEFFNNLNTIYNDIIDYYTIEQKSILDDLKKEQKIQNRDDAKQRKFEQKLAEKENERFNRLKTKIIKLLKEKAVKIPASDIDAFLKYQNVDEIKEACEKMYHNGDISRTANYRYFILSEEKKKPKKASAPKSEKVDVKAELKKFKDLLDNGLINQEDYDAKKKELLGL